MSIATEISGGCFASRSRRLARSVSKIYDAHLRPVGLRSSQLTVLVAVAAGTTRPVDIGARLDMDKSTVTRTLQLMETNGWLTRNTSTNPHTVALTTTGDALLATALKPWRAATDEVASRLEGNTTVPHLATDTA